MTHSQGSIALPQWYARFAAGDAYMPERATPGTDGTLRIGPLTVFHARQGCDVTTFGRPADPGVVLFDGYLFDRAQLSHDFELASEASYVDVASAAYQRWGVDVFDKLDGAYLLAIWDPGLGKLIVGHDAIGRHPVFYASQSDGVWFGSNVLSLAASGRISNRPDRVSLALATLTSWPSVGRTFFESIRRQRPGHYLEVTRTHAVSEHQYWSPWLDDDEPWLSEREVMEQFEPALIAAVSRCMELSPEGIMLSGGLDSVTVAALAADHRAAHGGPSIRAVSGRLDLPPREEERVQTGAAAALGMPPLISRHSQWTGGRDEVSLSLDAVHELPGPSRIYWVGTYMNFYRHTAAHQVRVLLTGSGGDNWLAVGDAYAADSMRALRVRELWRLMTSYMGTGGLSLTTATRHLLWSGGLRLILDSLTAQWMPGLKARYHRRTARAHLPEWLCPDQALQEVLIDTRLSHRPPALSGAGRIPKHYYRHAQRSTVNPYLPYEFETGFHVESTCGLRLLSPYHDRRLVRFFNSIPPTTLLHWCTVTATRGSCARWP